MKRKTISGDKQPRISSFFAQQSPKNATIDLTLEESEADEQPSIKKLKVGKGNTHTDQWRFDGTRRPSNERQITRDEDDKKRRHEEFKRVLLADNSSFARQKHQQDKGVQSSEDESLHDQDDAHEPGVSDEAFKNLKELFSHNSNKAKGKPRLTSSAKAKGTSEALGPGGEPYTPAELQASLAICLRVALLTMLLFNPSR